MEEKPKLPDLNTPPRPRHADPGYEVVDGKGNIVLPGMKSVDLGHETTEPLKTREQSTDQQPTTSNRQPVQALILTGFGIN